MISGKSRVFAVLGDPVAHSLSPAMQNAAFRALGLDAVYVALQCRAADLPGLLRALAAAGGGGNVTVPHKEVAAGAADRLSDIAELARACNTFWGADGGVEGDNTDVAGVAAAVAALEPPAGPWLILGTGGGARAAALAAARSGAGVAVRSRDPARRDAFEAWARSAGVGAADAAEFAVVVNATPLGLRPEDQHPFPPDEVPRNGVALDMVYAAGATRWVRALQARGVRAADGREMLVAQGAAAFERWFPGLAAPTEVMRAAVDAALR